MTLKVTYTPTPYPEVKTDTSDGQYFKKELRNVSNAFKALPNIPSSTSIINLVPATTVLGQVLISQVSAQAIWSSAPTLGIPGTTTGQLLVANGGAGGKTVTIQNISATVANYNWNLPATAGSAGQFLTSQGGGSAAMTWTTFSVSKKQIPNVMDYGAVNTGSTVPADMTATVNAFNAAWAVNKLIYAPDGHYCINSTLTAPNIDGAGIIGDGGLTKKNTIIDAVFSGADVIVSQATSFVFKGFYIKRTLSAGAGVVTVTGATSFVGRSALASTVGSGLKNAHVGTGASEANYTLVEDIVSEQSAVGIQLGGVAGGTCINCWAQYNSSHGISMADTSGLNALQWGLINIVSEFNGGDGFHIDDGGHATGCDPHFGLVTFNNAGYGYYANGVGNLKVTGCFFGSDGLDEVFVANCINGDYAHCFTQVITENSIAGFGFNIDPTNTSPIDLVQCGANVHFKSGFFNNSNVNISIRGGFFNKNGGGLIPGNRAGILSFAGNISVSGVQAVVLGNQLLGISLSAGVTNAVLLGNNCGAAGIASTAGTTYAPATSNY